MKISGMRPRGAAFAIAAFVLAACASGSATRTPPGRSTGHSGDPRATAVRMAEGAIATAPVPPGATVVRRTPTDLLANPASMPGVTHLAQRSRFWVVPTMSTSAAVAYLSAHRPQGLRRDGGGSMGGPDQPTVQYPDFAAPRETPPQLALLYGVVAYRSGVAIRADAQVTWVPDRPGWSMVPASVTSVDVVVVRQHLQLRHGAPTVRRTLRGGAARALASAANRFPEQWVVHHSCPAIVAGAQSDRLTFHAGGRTLVFVDDLVGCEDLTVSDGAHPLALGGSLDAPLLRALGLPSDYGR